MFCSSCSSWYRRPVELTMARHGRLTQAIVAQNSELHGTVKEFYENMINRMYNKSLWLAGVQLWTVVILCDTVVMLCDMLVGLFLNIL